MTRGASHTRRRPGPAEPGDATLDLGPGADPESVARTIVLNKLAAQPRSRHELAQALDAKAVPDEVAAAVLDRFEEVGLVDDGAFAAAWVRSRHSGRGLARRALTHELRGKGVPDEVIDASLDQLDPVDEWAAARRLVERRLASTRRFDRTTRARRLAGLLARKGYPTAMAMQVVRAALDADAEADANADALADVDTAAPVD